jgi:hypothetical protein
MKHLYESDIYVDKVLYIYRYLNILNSFINQILPKYICDILQPCYSGACIYKNNLKSLSNEQLNIVYEFLQKKYDLELTTLNDYLLDISDKIDKKNVEIEIDSNGYIIYIHIRSSKINYLLDILTDIKQLEKRVGKNIKTYFRDDVLEVHIPV